MIIETGCNAIVASRSFLGGSTRAAPTSRQNAETPRLRETPMPSTPSHRLAALHAAMTPCSLVNGRCCCPASRVYNMRLVCCRERPLSSCLPWSNRGLTSPFPLGGFQLVKDADLSLLMVSLARSLSLFCSISRLIIQLPD